ncbi:glycoside hydrolase family 3 C-terminal domain-containing protein [Thermomicrobium sp. 4228-Ro]|uniref:beta-glucosidase family protein n=1 Tax=Thermomicrobium sp. 4228-Ro TaxID=2993937 RepID=UPI002248D35D|nr:glycoside hydrolase family 3 C-terminal domain-containing protein [Thermomicrobium sp. 4228-Ro]MCX2728585.1 glycoside hydrolase family 3 C-terminal domain-containing protein [Thermomicrobium sp. 4228-Ro]
MESRRDIDKLVEMLTIDEKVALLAGDSMWTVPGVPRLGIRPLKVSDGPAGVRGSRIVPAAAFPAPVLLGATWDPELVKRVGHALAEEAETKGVHVVLAPTINIQRTSLGGRNFECFSEDPWLTARLAVAYVRGLQERGIGACIKHYVANDQEFERMTISVEVSERTLREVYLFPFAVAIAEADPWCVMAAYNRLGGTYCSEHPWLLTTVLREELGYPGVVMSDWFATHSTAQALRAGLDLEMPGPPQWRGEKLRDALQRGEVSEEVDRSARRILLLYERAGRLDPGPNVVEERAIDRPEHRALIREVAASGMVLLRNDGILPLDLTTYRRIAVIGPHATRPAVGGGGSAFVRSHRVISPVEALREVAPQCEFLIAEGAAIYKLIPQLEHSDVGVEGITLVLYPNPEFAGEAVATLPVPSTDFIWLGEVLPGVDATNFAARVRVLYRPTESGLYVLGASAVGQVRLFIDGELVLDNWTAPQPGRTYFGFGSAEQRAEVALEAGRTYELVAEYRKAQPGMPLAGFRFGVVHALTDAERIARAVRAAQEAELALVFAGLSPEWESEGFDRDSFDLPGSQNSLIEAVAAANPNTVVVLTAGSPVNLPWLDRVRALLLAWYAGEEVGHSVVDALTGVVEPAGRLPFTYPRRLEDTPAFLHYPGEFGRIAYCEGVFVGYRWYDARGIEPLFPFGYGSGYTEFLYRDLVLDRSILEPGETLRISCTVQNVGSRDGSEVVQLYIGFPGGSVRRPPKELRRFQRVQLAVGESRSVTFTIDSRDLAYFDEAAKLWVAPAGSYEVLVGSNARDIHLRQRFEHIQEQQWKAGERFLL